MRPYLVTALHWLHQIALTLWLGGILIVGAVTAPAVFGSAKRAGDTQPGTPLYDFASTVMTVIFQRFNWVVLAAGVLMLLCGLGYGLLARHCRTGVLLRAGLTAAALALAAWLAFGMFPQLLSARSSGSTEVFRTLHKTYSNGFSIQLLLLLGVALLTGWLDVGRGLRRADAAAAGESMEEPGRRVEKPRFVRG